MYMKAILRFNHGTEYNMMIHRGPISTSECIFRLFSRCNTIKECMQLAIASSLETSNELMKNRKVLQPISSLVIDKVLGNFYLII